MSVHLSLLPEKTAVVPGGLEYRPEFLTPSEEADLLGRIDTLEWLTDISRRVQHYGFKYDYSNRRLDEPARIGP
ncbi:MAG: hypothetical protein OXB99_14540 [Acidimicrobiaceae bacterium]|nr:hypothetical protein [Acidimicrobiaceae bacterium]